MWTARRIVSTGAPAYMRSRTAWIASSPLDAEDRRAEDLAGLGVGHDLDEALRLALLDGAADARHRPLADQDAAAGLRAASVSVMPQRPSGGSVKSA